MWKILCLAFLILFASGFEDNEFDDKKSVRAYSTPTDLIMLLNTLTAKYAKIALEIVHKSNFTTMATIAAQDPIKNYPVVNTIYVADSAMNQSSTGNVYFYLQKNDPIYANLKRKHVLTALFSNETTFSNNQTSRMETSGHQVVVAGTIAQLLVNTTEYDFAKSAIQNRHPDAIGVLKRLNTVLCKIEVDQIAMSDNKIGQFFIAGDDYFNADVDE